MSDIHDIRRTIRDRYNHMSTRMVNLNQNPFLSKTHPFNQYLQSHFLLNSLTYIPVSQSSQLGDVRSFASSFLISKKMTTFWVTSFFVFMCFVLYVVDRISTTAWKIP